KSWTIELALYWAERYNGQGYFGKGNSPYLWSWTTLYSAGKYVADGQYSPSFVDPQAGVAAIFKALETMGAVRFTREGGIAPQPQEKPVTTTPVIAPQGLPSFADIEKFVESADKVLPFI